MLYTAWKHPLAWKWLRSRGYWFAVVWSIPEERMEMMKSHARMQHEDSDELEHEARAIFRHVALTVRQPRMVSLWLLAGAVLLVATLAHGQTSTTDVQRIGGVKQTGDDVVDSVNHAVRTNCVSGCSGAVATQDVNIKQYNGVGVSATNPFYVTPGTGATFDVTDRSGRLVGHVTVDAAPSTAVTGTFWQATQPVSGTFWQATQPVSGTFWQATQPVSGTFWQGTQPVSIASMPLTPVTGTFWQSTQPVSIASMPSTPVTGTFWQATQPVSGSLGRSWNLGASDIPDLLDRAARLLGHVTVDSAPTTAVTGTFFQGTQPISVASLPLPTGAAQDSSLATIDTDIKAAQSRKLQDGSGNAITSAAVSTTQQALDVNIARPSMASGGMVPVMNVMAPPPLSPAQLANPLLYRAAMQAYCKQNLAGCASVWGGK